VLAFQVACGNLTDRARFRAAYQHVELREMNLSRLE